MDGGWRAQRKCTHLVQLAELDQLEKGVLEDVFGSAGVRRQLGRDACRTPTTQSDQRTLILKYLQGAISADMTKTTLLSRATKPMMHSLKVYLPMQVCQARGHDVQFQERFRLFFSC